LGFAHDVGAALHQHGGVDALHLQVVAARHALGDGHVAAHKVEGKAVAEHIAEIQHQPPWQRLQAEHAQQLGGSGLGAQKLAAPKVELQFAAQARGVENQR